MAPSLMHTAAVLKGLQHRYTAARVFVVGISIAAEESILDVAAPLNPTYEPCVPFGVKTVSVPKESQPCRWIRICGLYFLALSTVVDTLSRLTKLEVLEIGEEPGDLARVAIDESATSPKCASTPGCERVDGHKSFHTTSPAIAAKEDTRRAVCGCGATTCPHGHCAESCEGFACGECGNARSADK
jgi:hypothetical protein